jgi:hypothetical protein
MPYTDQTVERMNPEEKDLTHLESLQIIADAMRRTRENFKENSFYFMLWGWLIAIASFAFFVLHRYTDFEFYFILFPILSGVGIIVSIRHYQKQRSAAPTESYWSYFLSRLWLVLGICFIVVVFINVSQGLTPFTYTLILAAIGTLVSGLVMQFKPMIAGGIIFLLAAIASIFVAEDYSALLHGAAVIAGYLIPGYLLRASDK